MVLQETLSVNNELDEYLPWQILEIEIGSQYMSVVFMGIDVVI